MAVSVTLYNFTKKANSTAQPTGGTEISCQLRDGSDQFFPNIEIRGTNPTGYNYFYVPLFRRYYYKTTCTWNAEEHFWLLSGECDVLATFRTAIHNSYQWVTRCADSTYLDIPDNRNAIKSQARVVTHTANLPFAMSHSFSNSIVVCNIAGSGFVCMSGASYNTMIADFMRVTDPVDVGEYFTHDVARNLTNPASYIISAMCIPIPTLPSTGEGFNPLFGWYRTANTVYRLTENYITYSGSVGGGLHPQSNSVDDYLNYPPYTSHKLYISGLGLIALDEGKITGAENFRLLFTVDYTTGVVVVRVKKEFSDTVIGYATGQIGYSLAVAQVHTTDMLSILGGTAMGAVGGGMHAGLPGAVAGGAAGILGGIGNMGNSVSVHGSTGGAGGWYDTNTVAMNIEYKLVEKPYIYTNGRPYCRTTRLGELSGYVECAGGDVSCTGSLSEKAFIANTLQGGVYIE